MLQEGIYSYQAVERSVLPNGLVVLTERVPGLRSLSIGFWVLRGSRHEPEARSGAYHFLEHMLFKGTETRDTREIARRVDLVGGQVNAFTGKDSTCFYARILDEHTVTVVELLADLLQKPAFRPLDLERERKVILEELKMVDDTPDDLVQNMFLEELWKGNPLARPILGTRKTVKAMNPSVLGAFFRENVRPNSLLIAASGNVEHSAFLDLLWSHLRDFNGQAPAAPIAPPAVEPTVVIKSKPGLKQTYICLGSPSYPRNHNKRYPLSVLNTILGTGMSSRLFQTVREEQSLAYDVFSDTVSYADAGYLVVYAGTSADSLNALIDVVIAEMRNLTTQLVAEEELTRAKEHLKGNLMLGLESSFNRMTNLATQEIYFGRQETLDEILVGINQVTAEDVRSTAAHVFGRQKLSMAVLGKLPAPFDFDRKRLLI